jgi:hypothetical protein
MRHVFDASKDDLQVFNSRDPLYRRKLWVRVVTPDSVWYHIFWGRIFATLAVIAVSGWLLTAAGAWAFVRFQRGYTGASYLDFAFYPLRKETYRKGLGEHYLKMGRIELEKRNYQQGYSYLQAGLARVPNDVTGRRLFAAAQIAFGRSDLAITTLVDGADYASADLDYLKLLFSLLLEQREDERTVTLAKKLLPAQPDSVLVHQFIALQMATAHFERGRYDDAERIVADWQLEKSLEGSILLAKCDWERGFPELTMLRLERETNRFPKRDELYLNLVRYHRELGHAGEARRYALLRNFNDPASPGPRIDVLQEYHNTGDKRAEQRDLAAYLNDFSGDSRALGLLAGFAVDSAQPDLAAQLVSLARERRYPVNAFNLAWAQSLIATQKYKAALDLTVEVLGKDGEKNDPTSSALASLRCVALYGLKDFTSAELMLNAFLGKANLRAYDALLLARQLRLLGSTASARAVLERAFVLDRLNQSALGELIRIDAETGNRGKLTENLPVFLQMRKPSRAILEEVLLKLDQPGDAPLREQVREVITRTSATPAP